MTHQLIRGLQVQPSMDGDWEVARMTDGPGRGTVERYSTKQKAVDEAKNLAEEDSYPGVVVLRKDWTPQRVWLNYDCLQKPSNWMISQ